jgi:hypothetical protein
MQMDVRRLATHALLGALLLISGLVVQLSNGTLGSAATGDQQQIVYLDRDNNIWTSRTDGSDARQLTSQGDFGDVQFSADGTRIIATGPYEGETGVYLMSSDPNFGLRSLSRGHSPVWSPDSSRFAFIDGSAVHIFNRDGGYIRSAEAPSHELMWSPGGQYIATARNIIDPYGTGCAVRQLGWINADSGAVDTAGTMIGTFAWDAEGTGIVHVSAADGAVRSRSVESERNTVLSTTSVNPCGAPFFTTANGERLIGLRWFGEGQSDLVSINLHSGEEQIFNDVPVRFPASRLPGSYVTGDETGRYIHLVRSYPTDVHRLDLETGSISEILLNDWRQLVAFSPNGTHFSLLETPSGKAARMTIRNVDGGSFTLEDVGWMAWQPSPINQSASLAWRSSWEREDRPVSAGEPRTWLWGPDHFDARVEEYDESPGGFRAVRYYDKSRMELTNPGGNRSDDWYVTNGLLVRELITGQMQVGDGRFLEREPAEVPVAGDENDPSSPTYATLQSILDAPAVETGSEITATIDRNGNVDNDGPGEVTAAHYVSDTDHTVADVFWDYLNSTGRIWDGSQFTEGQLFDPTFFATGFPITEAYWVEVRVGGEQRDVLMQCFERRCLTYTPDNPEGWQVEMGNVGRHYHAWRY